MEETGKTEIAQGPYGGPAGSKVGKPIPKDLTAMKLLNVTKPFVIVRATVYAVVTAIMFVATLFALGASLLILYVSARTGGDWQTIATVVVLAIFASLIGAGIKFLKFAQEYCLYMIKAAHVAAITEYLRTGEVPVTEKGYKGVLAFGKERIGKHFGAANVAFVADKLVAAATKQIMRWANKAMDLLKFIPGSEKIFPIINFILSTALNFIDEAILSYVFYRSDEKSSFKKLCDGLVFYAQSWKGMIIGAAKVAAFVWILRTITFAVCCAFVVGIVMLFAGGSSIIALLAIIMAIIVTYGIQTVIIEPYATCMMIKDYHLAIEGQEVKADLYGTLCGVSKGFKDLFDKFKNEQVNAPDVPLPASMTESASNAQTATTAETASGTQA